MKNKLNILVYTLLCASLSYLFACITFDRRSEPQSYEQNKQWVSEQASAQKVAETQKLKDIGFYGDDQIISGLVNISHGNALTSAADQGNISDNSPKKSGAPNNKGDDLTILSKSCSASGAGRSAAVSSRVTVNRNMKKTVDMGSTTVTQSRTGNGSSSRVWSRTGNSAVECNATGHGAKIDFTSPAGTRLQLAFTRARSDTTKLASRTAVKTSTKSFKAKGTSLLTWASNDTSNDTSKTYSRHNSIEIKNSQYQVAMSDDKGTKRRIGVSMSTAPELPLVILVERDRTTQEVVSKTIVSGYINSQIDSEVKLTTAYQNLKVNFADGQCSIDSGSAKIVLYNDKGYEVKTLILESRNNGQATLQDSRGVEIEGFSLDPCDLEDWSL